MNQLICFLIYWTDKPDEVQTAPLFREKVGGL
jgi:hypothetical protein